jgi:hypothetical protein
VVILARLAVFLRDQRRGIGLGMLQDAMLSSLKTSVPAGSPGTAGSSKLRKG